MSVSIKSAREIEFMRAAGQIVAGALDVAKELAIPGVTTAEINASVNDYICTRNAYPSFMKVKGKSGYFPGAACTSINEVVVHGIPSDEILVEGDILSVDIGAEYEGYHGDAARTFTIGKVDEEVQRLINVCERSFWQGVEFARVGMRIGDISSAVQKCAEDAGFSVVLELIGHGIGRELHEEPDVPNYGPSGKGPRLQAGMVICIEPMINLGSEKILLSSDEWAIFTADGMPSAHYENTVLITDAEPEILTLRTKE